MEVVIIPWMHVLSDEHSKAMEFLRGVEEGSALAIEWDPEKLNSRFIKRMRESIPQFRLEKPLELTEVLKRSASHEAVTVAGEKKLKLHGISSTEVLRRQNVLLRDGIMTDTGTTSKLLKLDVEQEGFFASKVQDLLRRGNEKVYVLIGATHAENVAERLRRVEGIRVSLADTKSEDTEAYCEFRDELKRQAAEGRRPTDRDIVSLSNWLQRRMKSWESNGDALSKLEGIRIALRREMAGKVSRPGKQKRKRKATRKSKKRR